ncbi:flagellum biosynthesis protein FlbT [Jannaschia sp. Os4]|uniref:flagellar biosynthesis repressor FlbT n=1 Tax=Jannaschia sp. Os4 TaxID=2807617 RepID=UPI00193AD658|nr:flagellar biosynthesis repressor FlbT [Jannaschia sp. Os4]MBM2575674.1 flagellum biosynthesis protein FlbT [Jannaschia sp. Os4]
MKITLKAGEIVVINGCVIRNGTRRQSFWIETRADVMRGSDLMDPREAKTPVRRAYALAQAALLDPGARDESVRDLQRTLAGLAVEPSPSPVDVLTAANRASTSDFYGVLRALRPLVARDPDPSRARHASAPSACEDGPIR